jgi:UDP-2,3-diacylglucosamine pyrophosphatase LpxH
MSLATPSSGPRLKFRTVFISDVHLGFRGCQATYLLDFLAQVEADELVLVGDIVDLWSLRRTVYWPVSHHEVLKSILRLARSGTKVVYVPGNHDEGFRELCGAELAGIDIRRDFIHETADGKRYLVLHGDDFDAAVKFSGLLKDVGEWFYDVMLWLGAGIQRVRRRFGFGYWSLATWVKQKVPDARLYIERFEHAAAHAARKHGLDGVICGHIHRPGVRDVDGVRYCNDGDWVEHCSALVEDRSGGLALLNWAEVADARAAARRAAAAPLPEPALDTAA